MYMQAPLHACMHACVMPYFGLAVYFFRIRVISPVGRFAGSFRPGSFRPCFRGGSIRPY